MHVLVATDRMPVVTASASILRGSESVFARVEVDDLGNGGRARHAVRFALSGSRVAVLEVLAQLRAAVDAARPEGTAE